jgi:NAD(P)-dependent dehydrogenase (short-subunit alcohol dehydrogenase family)
MADGVGTDGSDDEPANDPVALVAGGTGAVGAAVCRALAARGIAVAVHCRSDIDGANGLASELRRRVASTAVAGNLVRSADADAIVSSVARELGSPPTIAVNAAYPRTHSQYVADSDEAEVERHLDGFRIHANLCRSVLPGMRERGWGRIILIAGALASRLWPGLALMSGVKSGLTTFTRSLALEEGVHGVTANVVSPGRLESEEGGAAFYPDPAYERLDEVTRLRVAQKAVPTPTDVASIVSFLVSDEADSVTGQTIFVAGGEPI